MRIQSKRPKAKEKGEGGGWRVGRGRVGRVRVRVMFEYVDFLHFDSEEFEALLVMVIGQSGV